MTALWAVLAAVVLLLGGAYVHLAGKVRRLGENVGQLGQYVEVIAEDANDELTRHDAILVEHDKQLTALADERLIGGGS